MSGRLDARANEATSKYQGLQTEFNNLVETRQKLAAQHTENVTVQAEFSKLTPNNTIYKLIGGCLIQQDQIEAKANVDKRIDFISSELSKVDAQMKTLNDRLEEAKLEIVRIQTELQQAQGGGGQSSGQQQQGQPAVAA